jgi:hypothetical protein
MKLAYPIYAIITGVIIALLIPACSRILIRGPGIISKSGFTITFITLISGPDQYTTAGGCLRPEKNNRYVWATVAIQNMCESEQLIYLKRIILIADRKEIKPFIIDMDFAVTMHADPEPRIAPGETISRKLIYSVPYSSMLEKICYYKEEIKISDN